MLKFTVCKSVFQSMLQYHRQSIISSKFCEITTQLLLQKICHEFDQDCSTLVKITINWCNKSNVLDTQHALASFGISTASGIKVVVRGGFIFVSLYQESEMVVYTVYTQQGVSRNEVACCFHATLFSTETCIYLVVGSPILLEHFLG